MFTEYIADFRIDSEIIRYTIVADKSILDLNKEDIERGMKENLECDECELLFFLEKDEILKNDL